MTTLVLALALVLAALPSPSRAQDVHDVVLRGGRVIDPATGLDAVRDVGITGDRIAAVSDTPLEGRRVVDVSGLVVAPGFVDLHAHGQDPFSSRLQARDGVTTALELEGGAASVAEWYAERAGNAVIHYGATVSHGGVRREVMGSDSAAVYAAADEAQMAAIEAGLRRGLDEGALGLGFGIQYVPGASREEILRSMAVGAEAGVTSFPHVRYAGAVEPESAVAAVQEMIAVAAATGASIHIVHIGSSGLGQVPLLLEMLDGARARGLDVTTEVYPYTAASTSIRSAIFDPGWRRKLDADYGDIEWVATGERLDSASFAARRAEGGTIIAHVIPESSVGAALSHPGVMVASDGVPFVDGRAHPRGAGTFARVLGRYVRDRGVLGLADAVARMSWLPARRLADAVPAMARKGRVQPGADADLTVFDPATVADRATFSEPAQGSEGIRWVMVAGTFVVEEGELVDDVLPGRPVRR